MFQKRKNPMDSIRRVIAGSRQSEALDTLPDRLSNIIERYNDLHVDPHFRHDVFNILNVACDIAESLVDETFPVETASDAVGRMLEINSRVLRYLQARPSRMGHSILIPESGHIVGHFATSAEATDYLNSMIAMGMSRHAMVIPVKLISQHALQPKKKELEAPQEPARNQIAEGPIPAGIRPSEVPASTPFEFQMEPTPLALEPAPKGRAPSDTPSPAFATRPRVAVVKPAIPIDEVKARVDTLLNDPLIKNGPADVSSSGNNKPASTS